MKPLLIILTALLSGCATTQYTALTKDADCAEQGGCVVVSRAAIVNTIRAQMQVGARAGYDAGAKSCKPGESL